MSKQQRTASMDLRAPLLDVEDDDTKRNDDLSPPWRRHCRACSKTEYTNNTVESPSTVTNEAKVDPTLYEIVIRRQLCKMHIASIVLELGSESRFTGIVLFHRYVREFCRHVVVSASTTTSCLTTAAKPTSNSNNRRKCRKAIESHLSNVASACILLGCKMEEEIRRIRDVINLSHMLNVDENDNVSDDDVNMTTHDIKSKQIVTIIESARPPPLDEKYWKTKENLVSVEQHVLRMIRFDTSVCHPHRCVLVIMETLGFGVGRRKRDDNILHEQQRHNNEKWLMQPNQSEGIILTAFQILNDAALDETGEALRQSAIVLSCAAISLAAVMGVVQNVGALKDDVVDCRMAANNSDNGLKVTVTLPDYWWRALDVSTKNFTIARDALEKRIEIEA